MGFAGLSTTFSADNNSYTYSYTSYISTNREQFCGCSNNLALITFLSKDQEQAFLGILGFPSGNSFFEDSHGSFWNRLIIPWRLVYLRAEQIPKWEEGNDSKLPLKEWGMWEGKEWEPQSFDLSALIRSVNIVCFQFWSHGQHSRFLTIFLKKSEALATFLCFWCDHNQLAQGSSNSLNSHSTYQPVSFACLSFDPWHRTLLKLSSCGSSSVGNLAKPLNHLILLSPTCQRSHCKAVTGDEVSWIDLKLLGNLKDALQNVRLGSSKWCAYELNSARQFGDGV